MESSDIVYKYRNWQNQFHKKTLYKNEIYLSKPSEFNDPFDCRIPTNYFLISDENLENFIGLILNSTQPYLTDLDTINSEKQMLRDRFADRSNFQLKSENIEFDLLNNHSCSREVIMHDFWQLGMQSFRQQCYTTFGSKNTQH